MDGVSHEPGSNTVDPGHVALQAGPVPDQTEDTSPTPLQQDMPLMQKGVLDLMMPSLVSSSLPPRVAEVDTLLRLASRIEPIALLDTFTDIFLAVDKTSFGADPDPLSDIIDTVAAQAQPPFYAAFSETAYPRLVDIVGRIRNWMVTLMRRKDYFRTGSALIVLVRLPLTEDIVRQVKLQAVIRKLEKESGAIGSTAKLIVEQLPGAFTESNSAAAPPTNGAAKKASPPKLFGNIGVLKLGSHKRQREPSPDPLPAPPKSENVQEGQRQESPESDAYSPSQSQSSDSPAAKRVKIKKSVHWRPDKDLVAVRYFEMEGEAKFKSAKNARAQEHDEGSAMHQGIDWATPRFIDFSDAFRTDFQSKMSSKRGGSLDPDSEEARVQEKREARVPMAMHPRDQLPDSPKEPSAQDAAPEASSKPRQGREPLTGAPVPPELRHKYEQPAPITPPMGGMPGSFMNPMAAAMAQMNPMMGYQFGAGYPMNMSQAQMSEMMARMSQGSMGNMYGFQGTGRR